ncbi:ead/Ea22-like family protein [Salmonella enterica]|nr:ead/Ea22-like family protein [Salmonella enterica]EBE4964600.1 ead/Ea22-like family protein [Salmonella enterica]EBT5331755.1 ead/Ea22-like family protein [Salmonella enterica]ECH4619083.1 ead/Ea22-like family protein [Salmonella enterica]EGG9186743.1 ead/Ea22-like family protein [Salmonella enterica]
MTIDKQALRQIAESVDREEWDVLDNGDADYQVIVSGSLERGATYRSYKPVTNEISNKKIAAFIAAFNPKVALALLDELEHYKSREERVTKLVLDNSTSWDVLYKKLEAAEKRIAEQREYYEGVIADGSKRIAELEAREVTLPQRLQPGADGYDDWYVHSADDGEYLKADDVIEAIRAAGIKVKES